jgi:hypothetical protein
MGQRLSSVQQFDSSIGTTDKFEQGSQDRHDKLNFEHGSKQNYCPVQ